ncbi:LOW QUALITY PROTEIN: GTPase Era, mitochondrial-like [Babylonia areolata]|uniref:LOW QUALITY PROTEIN: GTPase Era, mitochondrial-like n=1 Tax=Babylonia areolata TaxID=304850 RepID=UPI003FD62363
MGQVTEGPPLEETLQRIFMLVFINVGPGFASLSQFLCSQTTSSSFRGTHTTSSESADSAENQQCDLSEKGIGRSGVEQNYKMLLKPDQPEDARILRVAIIGLPNSGKSTLTNSLMGWRVSSVSKKVHTTRKNTTGVYTQDNTQIVFLDTPGILSPSQRKRHNLERSLLIDPERSLHQANLVCVLVDVSNKWTRSVLDPLILQVLHLHQHIPAVLVLNKVDLLLSKEVLLQLTRSLTQGTVDGQPVSAVTRRSRNQGKQLDREALFNAMEPSQPQIEADTGPDNEGEDNSAATEQAEETVCELQTTSPSEDEAWESYFRQVRRAGPAVQGMKGWPLFKRVFMVSALSGDGVKDVKDYLMQSAQPGDWDFHSSLVTSQDPRELVLLCVREKLLEHLRNEVPYNIALDIVLWEVDEDGMFNIIINASAQNRRQVSILLGPQGQTIQKIASEAKQEMMNAFRCEMRLKIIAKTKRTQRR